MRQLAERMAAADPGPLQILPPPPVSRKEFEELKRQLEEAQESIKRLLNQQHGLVLIADAALVTLRALSGQSLQHGTWMTELTKAASLLQAALASGIPMFTGAKEIIIPIHDHYQPGLFTVEAEKILRARGIIR